MGIVKEQLRLPGTDRYSKVCQEIGTERTDRNWSKNQSWSETDWSSKDWKELMETAKVVRTDWNSKDWMELIETAKAIRGWLSRNCIGFLKLSENYLKLIETAWSCLKLHGTIRNCIGLFETAWNCLKLHRTFLNPMELFKTAWNGLKLHGTACNCLKLLGAPWTILKLSGTTWWDFLELM